MTHGGPTGVHRLSRPLVLVVLPGLLIMAATSLLFGCGGGGGGGGTNSPTPVVLAWNDLGMHCMNEDFSEICILPPYNTLCATVIDRSTDEPRILTSGVTITYGVPGNTHSADKTNFWTYAQALLGASPAPNVGLTGNGLTGTMVPAAGQNWWTATGIPITPIDDTGKLNPYNLALVSAKPSAGALALTRAVVPVSWEMRCDLCHKTAGISTATDIINKHVAKHTTDTPLTRPVLCAQCHAEPNLGTTGDPGVPSLSQAMHGSHASRMAAAGLANPCYACHPGVQTQCLRDVHYSKGMTCVDCHGDMNAVADPRRRPWVDEPKCGSPTCHHKAGSEYEQSGARYRDSHGHSNVACPACHGSPHAIAPSVEPNDNVQAIALQGHAGTIDTCTVCHRQQPGDPFFHRVRD